MHRAGFDFFIDKPSNILYNKQAESRHIQENRGDAVEELYRCKKRCGSAA